MAADDDSSGAWWACGSRDQPSLQNFGLGFRAARAPHTTPQNPPAFWESAKALPALTTNENKEQRGTAANRTRGRSVIRSYLVLGSPVNPRNLQRGEGRAKLVAFPGVIAPAATIGPRGATGRPTIRHGKTPRS